MTRTRTVGLAITFLKKARGRLTAECRCEIPKITIDRTYEIEAAILDAEGDVVARATATWRLGPRT